MPPTRKSELAIPTEWHERICAGDKAVIEDLAFSVLAFLAGALRQSFRHVDVALINDAVVWAFVKYVSDPSIFDPDLGTPLSAFLYILARRRLLSLIRNEDRRKKREVHAALCRRAEYLSIEDRIDIRARLKWVISLLTNETDRTVLRLLLQGERETAGFAAVLGIQDVSAVVQRNLVKRAKDRIRRLLRTSVRNLEKSKAQGAKKG